MTVHDDPSAPIAYKPGDEDSALILPPYGVGVCPICAGVTDDTARVCINCEENERTLGAPSQPAIAISLYSKPSALRDWLTFYKDDRDRLANPAAVRAVREIFTRFLMVNSLWLETLGVDGLLVVPSTTRLPPHPLAKLLQSDERLSRPVLAGLRRTPQSLAHNVPHPGAFEVGAHLVGARILLVDDVYTSGARAQSAAFALRAAGIDVAALCVLGRRYNPSYSQRVATVFSQQRQRQFSWTVSARISQTSTVGPTW